MPERFELSGADFKQEYPRVVHEYLQLPSYVGRPDISAAQKEAQQIAYPPAEVHYRHIRDTAWDLVEDTGDYAEAVEVVREGLKQLSEQSFSPHDEKAVRIFFLRRLGRIYEHWASKGEEEKPLTDSSRRSHFGLATYYYMLGDLELGVMTEYSHRIAECLFGLGSHEAGHQFLVAFWGGNVVYANPDGIDLNETLRRGNLEGAEESGGVRIEGWLIDIPDSHLN